jgi:hypothetical protein
MKYDKERAVMSGRWRPAMVSDCEEEGGMMK